MVFRKHLALRKNKFWLVTDGCPIFPSTMGKPNAYVYNPKLQSNKTEAKNLQTELFRGKSGENIHKYFWLRKFWWKINKRFTGKSWKQFKFEPCYTCEETSQLSYKSRVLHSIMVVRACRVYSRGGLPQFSLFCLFLYICRQKICNWRWILHLSSYQDTNSTSWFLFVLLLIPEGY